MPRMIIGRMMAVSMAAMMMVVVIVFALVCVVCCMSPIIQTYRHCTTLIFTDNGTFSKVIACQT